MLRQLNLQNIVLVESAQIPFQPGFNVISGETGAGKSALMSALNQIQGARADAQLIRHGFDKGIIEAIFDIDELPSLQTLLKEAGIEHCEGEELLIRRELSVSGKSRLFINNQQAHLSSLKKIGKELFEIVGQHDNQRLFDISHHLEIVDLFGDLLALKKDFSDAFNKEMKARSELATMLENEQKRLRELEIFRMELDELEEAALKEEEEDELFAEYSRLTNTETLAKLSEQIASTLSNELAPVLNQLKRSSEELLRLDPALQDTHQLLQSSSIDLDELSYTYRNYHSKIEHDPLRVEEINSRLTVINKIKRKYGPSLDDVLTYQKEKATALSRLENAEYEMETLNQQISALSERTEQLAGKLSTKRKETAKFFEEAMTNELQSLNMPHALFFVEIIPQKRSRTGDERIEFFFVPNRGEKKVPIKECASGGEISRLLLSVQTLLAGKEAVPTLIFDEIDGNIGGQTAAIVGEKLSMIGKNHQLLCITHFPQVANLADHHVQISKSDREGRMVTNVAVLNAENREKELMRMVGK
jgi:DNA repair protein RecN (Recombination protein N)